MPEILASEKDFFIVYKPPGMHSSPGKNSDETIMEWCRRQFPELADLSGRRAGETGMLHRLDYETQGLLLFARTETGMDSFLKQQKEGIIIKEYSALAGKSKITLSGFPKEKPMLPQPLFLPRGQAVCSDAGSFEIKSAFRPYGVGRKAVRPVLNTGEPYYTSVIKVRCLSSEFLSFRLGIFRGFRHQIRSHLSWLGLPIINDRLYGGTSYGKGVLGLRACSLSFNDPVSGKEKSFLIGDLKLDDI